MLRNDEAMSHDDGLVSWQGGCVQISVTQGYHQAINREVLAKF